MEEVADEGRKRENDRRSEKEMAVVGVEGFPFRDRRNGQGESERKEGVRKKSRGRIRKERLEIQKRRNREDAHDRKVVFVFGMEIRLERGNEKRVGEDERVDFAPESVGENRKDADV